MTDNINLPLLVPVSIRDDLDSYKAFNFSLLLQKTNDHVNPDLPFATYVENQRKIDSFAWTQGIKIYDDPVRVFELSNRNTMNQSLSAFLAKQSDKVKAKVKVPPFVSFLNNTQVGINQRLNEFFQMKKDANLEYPFLIKSEKGNKAKMAHTFYCVNDSEGLQQALNDEGFMNDTLLCQQYVPHRETVHKIYAVGAWWRAPERRSIPHKKVIAGNFKFDSQTPFEEADFSENGSGYLNKGLVNEILATFSKEMGLSFYGIDILVDSRDGTHYIVDLNYLPNYGQIATKDLKKAISGFLDAKIAGDTREFGVSGSSTALKVATVAVAAGAMAAGYYAYKKNH